jgi:dTDP-4-amino-4,6-dideoxygalactose transaminase
VLNDGRMPAGPVLESPLSRMDSRPQSGTATTVEPASRGVPMLDLSRQYAAIHGEVMPRIEQVCASQHYILGEEVKEFERRSAEYLGCKEAVGCASGTDALWLALAGCNIGLGHEVITTPFSFFATASSILRAGARPVFVDVDADTLNISPAAVERRMRQYGRAKIRAIMPVHLYGQAADCAQIAGIAAEHKLRVIEDAAQAFGASWSGKRAGSMGDAAAFSFYPTKNLSCFGDGGLVTTNDSTVAERVRLLRNHGSRQRYYHEEIGWNSRLDSIQAAVLNVKLNHIDEWNQRRRERAAAYDLLFESSGLAAKDSDDNTPVRILGTLPQAEHIFHQYVVRVHRRDELRAFLSSRNIGSEIYYPVPLHMQKCFLYLGYAKGDLPQAELAAEEVLALPMFPELTADEQATVVNAIADFYS